MQFCQPHWDKMREEVDKRGLSSFVPDSGEEATYRLDRVLEEQEDTIDNFDPLMYMHWAIASNAMQVLSEIGDPLWLMQDWSEYGDEAFVSAMGCPICILNLLSYHHDIFCPFRDCAKEPGLTFDWYIEQAGQDAEDKARSFQE